MRRAREAPRTRPRRCANLGSLGTRGSVWVLAVHDGMLLGAVGDSSIKVW